MAVTKDERRRGQDNKRFLLRVHNVLSCNYLLHYIFCKVELVEECNDLQMVRDDESFYHQKKIAKLMSLHFIKRLLFHQIKI